MKEAKEGKAADSQAPTRKRSASSKSKACWPSGVSAVNAEKPRHEKASSLRALQRSAMTPPGYWSSA